MGLVTDWGRGQRAAWEKLQRKAEGTKCQPPTSSVSPPAPPFCLSTASPGGECPLSLTMWGHFSVGLVEQEAGPCPPGAPAQGKGGQM